MSYSYRSAAIAVVLAAVAGAALGQEIQRPPLDFEKSQRQEAPAAAGNQNSEPKHPDSSSFLPTLEKIESAIRSLKTEVDKKESDQKDQREKADLVAQQEMSRWAWWMMIPTWITAVLTAAALFAILRTLHHTRRAADYASDMVVEAKETTKAAMQGASEAQSANEIARRSGRPFILVSSVAHTMDEWKAGGPAFEWGFCLKNHGKSPAIIKQVNAQVVLSDIVPIFSGAPIHQAIDPHGAAKFRQMVDLQEERVGHDAIIEAGAIGGEISRGGMRLLWMNDIDEKTREERVELRRLIVGPNVLNYYLIVRLIYEDVFGSSFTTGACLRLDAPWWDISEQGGKKYNYRT